MSDLSIVLVDDDKSFVDMAKAKLDSAHDLFDISVCVSGEECISYVKSNDVDCIVCDYDMPKMNGIETLKNIREFSEIPFILFTGKGSEEVASEAFSNGATDYLQKSGSSEVYSLLANRIEKYVERHNLRVRQNKILNEKNRLLNRVNDAFISFDSNFQILHLNSRGIQFVNDVVDKEYSYADLIGENIWDIVPESSEGVFKSEYKDVLDSDEDVDFEAYYDEIDKWFNIRVFPSSNGVSVFIQDITQSKREKIEREEELELLFDLYNIASNGRLSYEERLSKAVQLGRDFMGVSFGFITQIEDGMQEIMLSENTINNSQLYAGAVCPIEESYCQNVLDAQDLISVTNASENDTIGKEEFKNFELESYISQRLFVNESVFGTLCFADFETRETEFTTAEVAIAELLAGWIGFEIERHLTRKELENHNKRLDAFARFVSHDLRNPLSVAMGFCEIEQDRQGEENRNLQKIEKSHNRMDNIISELLEFARSSNEISDMKKISVKEIATEAWENLSVGESKLHVDTDMVISGDYGKLLNVFENIMRNSIEHNDEAVSVYIGELSENVNGFYIEDDGVGIPEDEDLFVPDENGATRFGLLITKEILRAHEWDISQAKCDSGARFEILI